MPAEFPTPGDLACYLDRRVVQTPALRLLDEHLVAVGKGDVKRLIWTMPPQEGKPVTLGTVILMGDGSRRRIADVQVGDLVITHRGRPQRVSAVHDQGELAVVTITTHAGRVVTAALDHPFLTPTGWVDAGKLAVGDVLATVPSPATRCGQSLAAEAARLLGYFVGDGNTTASASSLNAAITSVDATTTADILACATALGFGAAARGNRVLLSGGVRPWLREHALAGCTSWTKRVPAEVFVQPTDIIAAFIGAYFACDGTVSRRGGARPDARLEFNSVSRELLGDVQHLLLRLGIGSTVRAKNTTFGGKPYVSWRLLLRRQDDVARFRELVPIHHAKAAVLADWPLQRTRFESPYIEDEIADIRAGDFEACRCLTVEEDHTFTAADLVVHNSQRVSRTFPLWLLLRNPDLRIAICSYEAGIARRWGRAVRNDIAAREELGLQIRPDTSAAHEWQLDGHDGGVYTVGIGGALTGRPIDGVLIIDDPLKGRAEADSEVFRQQCIEWWQETGSTRLAPGTPVIVVQTRWHEDDLAGWLPRNDEGWTVVNIPAVADHDPLVAADPLGREPGEYLESARGRTVEDWAQTARQVGARGWSALYQGRPSPAEGGILKRSWWRFYTGPRALPSADGAWRCQADQVIQSWDMSFKDTKASDFVVGQVWARRGAKAFLLDQVRDRMDFPAACDAVRALSAKWPQAALKLVEDKANGPAIIAQLRKDLPGLVAYNPKDSKEARAHAVSAFVEAGNVELPDPELAAWVGDFVEECAAFPNAAHDDQVDAMTQALHKLLLTPSLTNFFNRLDDGAAPAGNQLTGFFGALSSPN